MKKNIVTLDFLRARSVITERGCWEWSMGRDRDGYGLVRSAMETLRTHRAAWSLVHGQIPKGMVVCHRCDNPPCCNPAHLFVGTNGDNVRDAWNKGRGRLNNVKLTIAQVRAIRALPRYIHTAEEVAEIFGVSKHTVSEIRRKKTWKNVHETPGIPRRK